MTLREQFNEYCQNIRPCFKKCGCNACKWKWFESKRQADKDAVLKALRKGGLSSDGIIWKAIEKIFK